LRHGQNWRKTKRHCPKGKALGLFSAPVPASNARTADPPSILPHSRMAAVVVVVMMVVMMVVMALVIVIIAIIAIITIAIIAIIAITTVMQSCPPRRLRQRMTLWGVF